MAADEEMEHHLEHWKQCKMKEALCEDCLSLNLASLHLVSLPQSFSMIAQNLQQLYLDYNELVDLAPGVFTLLPQLRVLSLIGNNISQLPSDISLMRRLEELYLNENCIKQLPSTFFQLNHLKVLNLVGNQLQNFFILVETMKSLEFLHLDDNQLEELPELFGFLTNLKYLDLESNLLTSLPESFGSLHELVILNLSGNKLKFLPQSFGQLESLENLDISSNGLKELPPVMKSSCCLKKFYVENNDITDLPDWVGHLPELVEMSMKDNHLTHQAIPDSFGLVSKKLRDLHMGGNFMSLLPDTIGELENLERLHLGSVIMEIERRNFQNGNWLWKIPDSFCKLTMLKSVNLDENQLRELPESFGSLVNMENLDLGEHFGRMNFFKAYSMATSSHLVICGNISIQ